MNEGVKAHGFHVVVVVDAVAVAVVVVVNINRTENHTYVSTAEIEERNE